MKKGQEYIAKDCRHLKNLRLYAHRGSKSILVQINRLVGEGNWKIVQMKSIFHVLFHGRSMLEYESLYDLFKSLNVPNNSSIYWSNNGGWTLLNSCSCKSIRLNSQGHSIFQHYYKMWVQFTSSRSLDQWIHSKSNEITWRTRTHFVVVQVPSNLMWWNYNHW